ncbi:MAG: TraR/DksA C4-type zinc finger protein [Patescibacteria group bacterium]|nr:TraR/DksA C4-type zinc finger protein [Patescibacteria group bacterium]
MNMTQKKIEYFKQKLEKEKALIEEELRTISSRDTENPGGWIATSGSMDIDQADESELADKMEELEDNQGIVGSLDRQLKEVTDALARIEKGTYGICEVSGKPIGEDRLEANPAARTLAEYTKK